MPVKVVFDAGGWDGTKMAGMEVPVADRIDIEGIVTMARKAIQHVPADDRVYFRERIKEFRKFMMRFWDVHARKEVVEWLDTDNATITIGHNDIIVRLPVRKAWFTDVKARGVGLPGAILEPVVKTWGTRFMAIVDDDAVTIYGGVDE